LLTNLSLQFLLVRPAPSFNITFTSATMRDEDVMQTEFFQHIGGSVRVRDGLKDALSQGHKVTAKVRWSSRYRRKGAESKMPTTPTRPFAGSSYNGSYGRGGGGDEGFWIDNPRDGPPPPSRSSRKDDIDGELRWIHCTPLVDSTGRIGVWVIMLIDE
jgi:hypothetical protein